MAKLMWVTLNTLFPGAGLLLGGRPWLGCALLLPALALLSVVALGFAEHGEPAAMLKAASALIVYLALAALAALAAWWRELHQRFDPTLVRSLYREAAVGYLRDDLPAAETAARRLVRLMPDEPGAWRVLELVARAQGAERAATNAGQRAHGLETRAL